jgi:hypothetical protein
MTDQSPEPQKLSDILDSFGIKRSTLKDWVDAGVLEITEHHFKGRSHKSRGRRMQAIETDQVNRLERFMRYRECLFKAEVIDLVLLLDQEDSGDLKSVLTSMKVYEENIKDALQDIQVEISRIHAQLEGDELITPESEDWEG